MGYRKIAQINLFAKQKKRRRCREQMYGWKVGRRDKLGNWDRHIYTTMYKIDN